MRTSSVAVPLLLSLAALAIAPTLQDPAPATARWEHRVIEARWSRAHETWYDSAAPGEGWSLRDFCARFDPRFRDELDFAGEPARPVSPAVVLDLVAAEGFELVTHGRWPTSTAVGDGWQEVECWDEAWTWRRRVPAAPR